MLRASRVIASRAVVGLGGVTVAGGATATAYAYTEQGAGFRREAQFWSKIFPVVFDYYWKTAASSPRVKYIKWKTRMPNDNDDDDNDNNSERVWSGTKKELLQQLHETHAPDILDVMLDLKGLYVKLGQVLSVTALPIPEPYRVLFRTLQSDVPGWETFDDVVKPVLEKEFGRPLDQLFEYVDPIPCGAASIGQAHRARLLKATRTRCDDEDNHNMEEDTTITAASTSTNNHNREVIIKVQYPDAAWQVPADIQCVGDFLKICVWTGVVDESSARLSFEEFSRQFLAELDYERECQNLQEVYQSSLDPTAPYMRRHVIMPKVFRELCTKKVITMTYLPGPKLEAEARRQLALLGIDMSNTNGGLEKIVRDAAKEAENPDEPESGELVRRVTVKMDADSNSNSNSPPGRSKPKSPFSWKLTASRMMGDVLGVDSILWAVRMVRRLVLLSQAAMVTSIRTAPTAVVPPTWASWAEAHRTASAQAARLNLTKDWLDALFDVHGHQIFNLGLFNADPHPGNILVIEEDDDAPSTTLGLIDYGQCKRLTPQEQVQVAQLVLAVANKESDLAVATAFRNLNITTKNDDTEFLANFGRLMFGPLLPKYMDHGWHRKLHQQDQVLYFPKELSMVYRTSLLLRGLAVSLQLNYTVGDTWKGHAQQAIDRNPHIVQELKLKQNSAAVSKETDTSIRDLTTDQPSITTRQQL